jgi:tetratricopeptide (TPR) repeat protein
MKKIVFLLFFLTAVPLSAAEPAKITDPEAYVKRLMQLSAEGENNSWLVLDSLSLQMTEKSAVFKVILAEAENNNDRAKYLLGRFYAAEGKNEEAIKWLGKVTSDRYRNARFLLASALMNKAKRTSEELYYVGAAEILNGLKSVTVEALKNTESIDFLIKACEKGTLERRIFTQMEKIK